MDEAIQELTTRHAQAPGTSGRHDRVQTKGESTNNNVAFRSLSMGCMFGLFQISGRPGDSPTGLSLWTEASNGLGTNTRGNISPSLANERQYLSNLFIIQGDMPWWHNFGEMFVLDDDVSSQSSQDNSNQTVR